MYRFTLIPSYSILDLVVKDGRLKTDVSLTIWVAWETRVACIIQLEADGLQGIKVPDAFYEVHFNWMLEDPDISVDLQMTAQMDAAATGSSKDSSRIFLFSGHDTTVMPVVASLIGDEMNRWPPYLANVVSHKPKLQNRDSDVRMSM